MIKRYVLILISFFLKKNHIMRTSILILFTFFSFFKIQAQTENLNPPFIKSIFFGGGDYYIDRQQKQELNDFLDSIDGLEQYQIYVTSHTDSIGSLEYNQWLSQMRSSSVLSVLEERGIPKEVVSKKDYGEVNPDFSNSTWEGKLQNRRADVIIVPPDS